MTTFEFLKQKNGLTYGEKILVLEEVLGLAKEKFISVNPILKKRQISELEKIIERTRKNEPLAYILGYKYFFDSKFIVDKHTLIPRPETELLVDMAVRKIGKTKSHLLKVLEVGTGTGCISISIAKKINENKTKYPIIRILATEIDGMALKIAKRNAANILGEFPQKNLKFQKADIINNKNTTKFDLIISNPPYIPTNELSKLDKSVKDFEPHLALNGGEDGLDIYKKLFERVPGLANKSCSILLEIHENYAEEVQGLAQTILKENAKVNVFKDLTSSNRFLDIEYRHN